MSDTEEYRKLLKEKEELQVKLELDPREEARKIYTLIFKKRFKVGGDWIERNKRVGRKTMMNVSLLGGVRHLWGNLHTEERVQAAMDRRGTNAIIQGPASNIGFRAGYELRKMIWEFYESRGVMIGVLPCNMVHDASEFEVPPVNVPLFDYLVTHAFSTKLHLWMRDVMGFESTISFERDCAIGSTQAEMYDAVRWDDQVSAVRKSLEWKRTNLKVEEPIDDIMKVVQHNAEIIFDIRQKEIKEQLRLNQRVGYTMTINRDNALKLGLKFKTPKPIKNEVSDETWKKELVE
jgi:hypothetical protein